MADELIPITVALTSKSHKFLTRRAQRLGRDRDLEAGRLLTWAINELLRRAAESEAPKVYTQEQFDGHMAGARKSYEAKIEALRERLRALGELE